MQTFIKSAITAGVVLWVALMCSPLWAEAKTVTLGVYTWEPYISEQKKSNGVIVDIVVAALEKMGYTVVIKPQPFARIMESLKHGLIDLAPAISRNAEREKILNFSSPIYDLKQGFTFKKGKIPYKTISDLKPYIGGIMRGAFWRQELEAAGIRYEEVTKQKQNINKLVLDRVDFVCMPNDIARYLLTTLGEEPSKYGFGLFKREGQLVGISKKTQFRELPDDFEKGLTSIKNDGTYDAILSLTYQ